MRRPASSHFACNSRRIEVILVGAGAGACLLALSLLGAGTALADPDDPAAAAPAARSGQTLSVEAHYRIPIPEVSGLALRPQDPPAIDIHAVGDAGYRIGRVTLDAPSGPARIDTIDATPLFGNGTTAASQWEAAATDGRGRLCVLAEVSSRVSCFGADLQTLSASFTLDPSSIGSLDKSWKKEPNSRGEGMVLMKRGHLLLLKEKKPSLLIEFGPPGDLPMGYGPDTFLAAGEEWILPSQDKLVALKVWRFSRRLAAMAGDASDLTVGPDGRAYLLSDESAIVVRLEKRLKPDQAEVHASAAWALPTEIVKPEGLVIDREMHPWVAVDRRGDERPNLYRLRRISGS
jgi:hypothetical protein